jgi:hypothetical protein
MDKVFCDSVLRLGKRCLLIRVRLFHRHFGLLRFGNFLSDSFPFVTVNSHIPAAVGTELVLPVLAFDAEAYRARFAKMIARIPTQLPCLPMISIKPSKLNLAEPIASGSFYAGVTQ